MTSNPQTGPTSRRTLFIHGAPAPHPLHGSLARSIGADSVTVDRFLQCGANTSRLRRYLSWVVNGLLLPRRYDLYLTEGPQIPPLVLKWLHLLPKKQRVAALLANETLFFLKAGQYEGRTRTFLLRALGTFDAVVCMGPMQAALAEDVLTAVHPRPRIFGCRTGLDEDRRLSLGRVTPDLESKLLVFVGHGPSGWRGWYKGLDLLFETVALLQSRGAGVRLRIAGSWDPAFIAALIGAARLDPLHVELLGPLENPASAFEGACLYVHLGRGDAWPVSVLEAMSAGLPALVSQWTGSKQAVEQVEGQLVVPLEAQEAAARIEWYLTQPPETRRHLGRRSREVAAGFDMERACAEFARVIHELVP